MAKKTISYDPQILNLKLYAGDGVGLRLIVKDTLGAAIDLSGELIAQIRPSRESVDPPSAEFTVHDEDIVDGIVILSLTGEQTHSLITEEEKFVGVWDVQWTSVGAEPITLVQGGVECVADVSH